MHERQEGAGARLPRLAGREAWIHGAPARRRIPSAAAIGAALAWFALPAALAAGDAPTTEQVEQKIHEAGYSDADVRRRIEGSGLSAEEVRDRLKQSGLPPEALDRYLAAPPTSAPPTVTRGDSGAASPTDLRPAAGPPLAGITGRGLEPFGYEIFGYSPTTFEPLGYGPVDPDYTLGPGDELVLTLWGDDQLSLTLPVSREGVVTLPEAGQVLVSGLTLEAGRQRLRGALARVYSGLKPNGRGTTFLDVSLGRLRSIQVFLLGDVVRPGGYTVSAVSRVLNALYAAGGPRRSGSMREIRVMREHRLVTVVDLYDYVLGGDTSKEVRLQNGDVIFVPPAGKRVALLGPVRRSARFELTAQENLKALLRLAGGVLVTADLDRAQIDRIVPFDERPRRPGQDRVAIDVPLGPVLSSPDADVPLQDLDVVEVFAIGNSRTNTVEIAGQSVLKPGTFEFHPGMRLKDLVHAAGGLGPDAFLERAQITRTAADRSRTILHVNLGRALAGDPEHDLELQALDAVSVASVWNLRDRYTVTVDGMVRSPGSYEHLEGMTLGDLLFKAGGLTDAAYRLRAEVARSDSATRARGKLADTLSFALDGDFAMVPEVRSLPLKAHDAVFIRRNPDYQLQRLVAVSGEVRFPGRYALSDHRERLADLVRRAGGVTAFAYARGAEFKRANGTGRVAVRLDQALRNERDLDNVELAEGDALHVPRYEPVVKVEGAVRNPVSVLFNPGAGVPYYLEQASGLLPNADRGRAVVVAPNGDVRRAGGIFGGPTPLPGSRIVVPARPPREDREVLKEVASVVGIVTSALTMAYLIQQANR